MRRVAEGLTELVRRHEITAHRVFRTRRPPFDLLPKIDFGPAEVDFGRCRRTSGARMTRVVREEGRKPFDLSRAPLSADHGARVTARAPLAIHHSSCRATNGPWS